MMRAHDFFRLSLLALLIAVTPAAMAADEVGARAMKLYDKHSYEEAARLLRPQLATMDSPSQPAARLTLGMIYLRSAELYQELQRSALLVETDYLKKLSAQNGVNASHYSDFFLGRALLEDDKLAEGVKYLQRFATSSATAPDYKSYANVELGAAYWRQKQTQQARALWGAVDAKLPTEKAALAAAYATAGVQERHLQDMADSAVSEVKKQGKAPDTMMLINLLRAYSQGGAAEKALDLLANFEFRNASYVETLGRSKTINFYDSGLLGDIALAHLRAAVLYLEQAGRDPKLGNTAAYFLADAYLLLGDAELSQRQATLFLTQSQMPAQYRDHARSRQAAAQYLGGKRQVANVIWTDLAEQSSSRPELLAEVVLSCMQARADCAKFVQRAVTASEAGEGKKYFPLNAALGKYYLSRKDYARAILFMEAGRDKANKNKIEANDPVLLAGLALAYYHNKKFSESLEIYFEMSKQYPAVRQIQDAMQGIYAMEQQSAGDVKIF